MSGIRNCYYAIDIYTQGSYVIFNINFQTFSKRFSGLFPNLTFSEWYNQIKDRHYDSYDLKSNYLSLLSQKSE